MYWNTVRSSKAHLGQVSGRDERIAGGEKHSHITDSLLPHMFRRRDMASWLKADTGQLITTTDRVAVDLLARDLTCETRVGSLAEVGMEQHTLHEVAKRIK